VSEQVAARDRKMLEGPESPPLHEVLFGRALDPNSDRNAWTLLKSISGHYRRWLDFVWLAYSAFFWIGPVLRNQLGYWIVFGCVYTLFLGLYSARRTVLGSHPSFPHRPLLTRDGGSCAYSHSCQSASIVSRRTEEARA
jgi:hypothetical protein